ncbi:hypothetical protein CAPGI0001_1305 [Capnocytophaga gingivalis ATCC 33624]|uniref:hypothetical protein n=1 Tax=Capnocytophaga gingivalis TaxID=1017 RepID=UPI00019FAFE4|nr:hypothetical protein [Capnocytophaga gingivalis]EEK14700.1 hypothetical protein CAPGI0001_1305 [Capnocytophaga gingivalis ATCC 33624]
MIDKIVKILNKNKSSIKIEDDIISCIYRIDSLEFLRELSDNELITNSFFEDYNTDEDIVLEFLISRLRSQGFYLSKKSFLTWNQYNYPEKEVYIHEINDFLINNVFFNERFSTIINLIDILGQNSKIKYNEDEFLNFLIVREDKSLLLYLKYLPEDLDLIDNTDLNNINNFIQILKEDIAPDRKNIYINELIDYLLPIEEKNRFSYLIKNFNEFIHRASASYNYYLRNFSYYKLKIELDTKALDFYQKIQGVVNDSQTKLIAIPTAIVFASTTLDYENINSMKNYLILVGMIMFCIFIQIFINNQESALEFIERNITIYKQSFSDNKQILENSFIKVDKERNKQKCRLLTIQILLWSSPILIFILLFITNIEIKSKYIYKIYKFLFDNSLMRIILQI